MDLIYLTPLAMYKHIIMKMADKLEIGE